MAKYACEACGWVYDEDEGCEELGIEAGTLFIDLPDDFTCPVCGVGTDEFEKEDEDED